MKRIVTKAALVLLVAACSGDPGSDDGPVHTGDPVEELPEVYLNEFVAWNSAGLQDEVGAYPDWIELYNASDADADLSGWWLTDDVSDPFNWQVPEGTTIPAGGFLVIFADGDTDEGPLHAGFNLDQLGEDLALLGPNVMDNPVVDSLEAFGAQAENTSLARKPDGGAWEVEPAPTPGATNSGR